MLKKLLFILHVVSICFIALHLSCKYFFNIGFAQQVIFNIKIVTVLSGLLIAIFYLKSLYTKRYYFAMYPIGITLFLIGYLLRGMFGGILMSATQYPIIADEVAYSKEPITIYTKYTGFFSRCCTYTVLEEKAGVFEKYYGAFSLEGQSSLQIKKIENTPENLKITYKDYVYDAAVKGMVLIDKTLIFKK